MIEGDSGLMPGKPRIYNAATYEAKLLDPVNLRLLEELSLDGRLGVADWVAASACRRPR
jgi:hypothetical protein